MSQVSNAIADAESTFEKTVDTFAGHLKGLISFAGEQRDRITDVAGDVGALTQKVETDVMAKLDTYKADIEASIMEQVTTKIQAVVDDFGAQISALTSGASPSPSPSPAPAPTPAVADPTVVTSATVAAAPTGGVTIMADGTQIGG